MKDIKQKFIYQSKLNAFDKMIRKIDISKSIIYSITREEALLLMEMLRDSYQIKPHELWIDYMSDINKHKGSEQMIPILHFEMINEDILKVDYDIIEIEYFIDENLGERI